MYHRTILGLASQNRLSLTGFLSCSSSPPYFLYFSKQKPKLLNNILPKRTLLRLIMYCSISLVTKVSRSALARHTLRVDLHLHLKLNTARHDCWRINNIVKKKKTNNSSDDSARNKRQEARGSYSDSTQWNEWRPTPQATSQVTK